MQSSQMNVVQVLPSMRRAGAESAVATLSIALASLGIRVTLVVLGGEFDYQTDLAESGVDVQLLNTYQGRVAFYDLRTRRHIQMSVCDFFDQNKADVIHFHLQHSLVFCRYALRHSRAVHMYTFHSLDPMFSGGLRNYFRKRIFQHVVAEADVRLMAVSSGVRDYCARGMGLEPSAIRVQPNPIDLTRWQLPATEVQGVVPSREIAIVGTLYSLKRVDIAIRAVSQLVDLGHQFHLKIIGDGPMRDRLQDMVVELRLQNRVTFVGKTSDIVQELQRCWVLWLLSEREGMPMVILEAMALGIPVITTNAPGTKELVFDGLNGLTVPVGNVQAVVQSTLELWSRPELRASLVAEAKRTVRNYRSDVVATQHLHSYRIAITGSRTH